MNLQRKEVFVSPAATSQVREIIRSRTREGEGLVIGAFRGGGGHAGVRGALVMSLAAHPQGTAAEEHARLAERMLPAGLTVLGCFMVVSGGARKHGEIESFAARAANVVDTLGNSGRGSSTAVALLVNSDDVRNVVGRLSVPPTSTSSKKREIVPVDVRLVDRSSEMTKIGRGDFRLVKVTTVFELDSSFDCSRLPTKRTGLPAIEEAVKRMCSAEEARMRSSFLASSSPDGASPFGPAGATSAVLHPDEQLAECVERTKLASSAGNRPPSSAPHDGLHVSFLNLFSSGKSLRTSRAGVGRRPEHQAPGLEGKTCSLKMRGRLYGVAYCHARDTVSRVKDALISDVMRSLRSRMDIVVSDADVSGADEDLVCFLRPLPDGEQRRGTARVHMRPFTRHMPSRVEFPISLMHGEEDASAAASATVTLTGYVFTDDDGGVDAHEVEDATAGCSEIIGMGVRSQEAIFPEADMTRNSTSTAARNLRDAGWDAGDVTSSGKSHGISPGAPKPHLDSISILLALIVFLAAVVLAMLWKILR